MVEDLIALLEKERTRQVLRDWWKECQADLAAHSHIVLDEDAESYGNPSDEEAFEFALGESQCADGPIWEMRTQILGKFPPPRIVTEHELAHALIRLLPWRLPEFYSLHVFDEAYPAFLNHVRSLLSGHRSKPFAIAQLPVFSKGAPADAEDEVIELWSARGVSVSTCGIGRPDIDPEFGADEVSEGPNLLYARVTGRFSPDALRDFVREVSAVIRTLVRTLRVIDDPDEPCRGAHPAVPTGLPVASIDHVRGQVDFVRNCIDSYFVRPTSKKDSLDRRIRNAVTLLVQSDTQPNEAIALALGVTAIEALLGEGKIEISAGLRDHVAALLEPDPQYRDAANAFMKNIYGDRSDVLHGKLHETTARRWQDTRMLAGGVLYAVVTYIGFLRRADFDPQTPSEFLDELRKGKYVAGQPIGVPELEYVRKLWRKD